jgi:hypothetical protein
MAGRRRPFVGIRSRAGCWVAKSRARVASLTGLLRELADDLLAGVDVAVALLRAEGPVGVVVGGGGADIVEALGGGFVELEVGAGEVLLELREVARCDDGGRHRVGWSPS